MARITVEDCLLKVPNRFALVHLAYKRAKQLLQGSKSLSKDAKNNKSVVASLREVSEGYIRFMTEEEQEIARERARSEAEAEANAPLAVTPITDASLNGDSLLADILGGDDDGDDLLDDEELK